MSEDKGGEYTWRLSQELKSSCLVFSYIRGSCALPHVRGQGGRVHQAAESGTKILLCSATYAAAVLFRMSEDKGGEYTKRLSQELKSSLYQRGQQEEPLWGSEHMAPPDLQVRKYSPASGQKVHSQAHLTPRAWTGAVQF